MSLNLTAADASEEDLLLVGRATLAELEAEGILVVDVGENGKRHLHGPGVGRSPRLFVDTYIAQAKAHGLRVTKGAHELPKAARKVTHIKGAIKCVRHALVPSPARERGTCRKQPGDYDLPLLPHRMVATGRFEIAHSVLAELYASRDKDPSEADVLEVLSAAVHPEDVERLRAPKHKAKKVSWKGLPARAESDGQPRCSWSGGRLPPDAHGSQRFLDEHRNRAKKKLYRARKEARDPDRLTARVLELEGEGYLRWYAIEVALEEDRRPSLREPSPRDLEHVEGETDPELATILEQHWPTPTSARSSAPRRKPPYSAKSTNARLRERARSSSARHRDALAERAARELDEADVELLVPRWRSAWRRTYAGLQRQGFAHGEAVSEAWFKIAKRMERAGA